MARSATYDDILLLESTGGARTSALDSARFEVGTSHRLADAEADWRLLTQGSIESPGQSVDFIRLWTRALGIAEADQYFVVARIDELTDNSEDGEECADRHRAIGP